VADLLIRDLPDEIIRLLEAKARADGMAIEAYARAVVEGRKPPVTANLDDDEDLVELTLRHLAEFPAVLQPMSKRDMREGMDE
jgi:plasmid stability protein